MTSVDAIIFDFDGVLVESEFHGNQLLAQLLTEFGHPTSVEDAINQFVGLSGPDFFAAIERRIGGPLPPEFQERRRAQTARVLKEGLLAVVGAIEFVRSLPPDLPRAIASGSTSRWIRTHLDHLGLTDAFGDHTPKQAEVVDLMARLRASLAGKPVGKKAAGSAGKPAASKPRKPARRSRRVA